MAAKLRLLTVGVLASVLAAGTLVAMFPTAAAACDPDDCVKATFRLESSAARAAHLFARDVRGTPVSVVQANQDNVRAFANQAPPALLEGAGAELAAVLATAQCAQLGPDQVAECVLVQVAAAGNTTLDVVEDSGARVLVLEVLEDSRGMGGRVVDHARNFASELSGATRDFTSDVTA